MNLESGGLIEIADYNDLAFNVNQIFSDNTPNLMWSSSNLILDDTAAGAGEAAGAIRTFTTDPLENDFLVVTVNNITLFETADYTIDYSNPVTITFLDPLSGSAILRVYNRQDHRFGWGQQASVYPITTGQDILADEATLQAYLEANTNNLIDKTNIMEVRIDGPTQLTRIATGKIVEYTDKTLIQTTLDTDVTAGDGPWRNEVATATGEAENFSRTDDWNNVLIGVMRHSWDDYDSMRYFFNSGGELRANVAMTGDVSNQGYNNWGQVTDAMGTLSLNYDTTFQTGRNGITNNLGAYELTTEWQTIFTSGSPEVPVDENGDFDAYGTYTNLVMIWEARIVEDTPLAGNVSLDIRVTMDDLDLNDTFVGTTTYRGGYLLADDVTDSSAVFSMTDNTPVLTVETSFTDSDLVVTTDFTIVSMAQTNPVVVTVTPDIGGLQTGNKLIFRNVSGMTEVNDNCYVITVIDSQSFSLNDTDGTVFTAYTSGGTASRQEWIDWTAQGGDGTSLAAGFTQDTGYMDAAVSVDILSTSASFEVSTDSIYVASGECFDDASSTFINAGTSSGDQVRVTIDLTPSAGVNANTDVQNVHFRISDIELTASRNERVTVTATDSSLASTAITYDLGSNLQESAGIVNGSTVATVTPTDASNSVRFDIAGPVKTIVILYDVPNDDNGAVWMSDFYYEPQPA